MRRPTVSDYVRTLENPFGVFRTLGEVEARRDIYMNIELRAGNSAAVFTYRAADGSRRLLKCYVRPNARLRELYSYVERHRPPLLARVRLLEDELYVLSLSGNDDWVDVVEGEWTEGETLDAVVWRACREGDTQRLEVLAQTFDALCRQLLAEEWAHGDLKPENIVVGPDGAMTLIDCDAMWIPDFAGQRAVELGTPAYRHPARDASCYDKRIDDYPMKLLSASLHAIALDPALFGRYNTTDNIIFSPVELVEGRSAAFGEVKELFALHGMARETRMLEACCAPWDEADSAELFFTTMSAPLSGTLVPIVRKGKWGFADSDGITRIPPFWDEVLDFRGSCAAVRLRERWHTLDRSGNIVPRG